MNTSFHNGAEIDDKYYIGTSSTNPVEDDDEMIDQSANTISI